MLRKLHLSTAFLLFGGLCALQAQDIYYVDAVNGDDGNTGRSLDQALATLLAVGDRLTPGDQVLIYPGVYRELGRDDINNTVFISRSGSAEGGYIRYTGVSDGAGDKPVIESSGRSAFGIQDRQYLIIENLELRPSPDNPKGLSDADFYKRAGINVSLGGQRESHHLIFRDLYIHDFGAAGISVSGSDVIWVDGNVIEHCAYGSDIATSGISFFRVRDFDVPGFSIAGTEDLADYRIIVTGNTSRYNVNLRPFFAQGAITDGQGIILDDFRDVELLDEGSLNEGAPSGPEAYSGRSLIQGNECYGNGGPGINAFLVERVDIYGNTLFDNAQTSKIDQPGFTINQTSGQIQVGGAQDVNVRNNIFVNTNPEADRTVSTFINAPETDGIPVEFSHNLHYNTAGDLDLQRDVADPTDVLDAPDFRGATPLSPEQTELLATAEAPFTFGGAPSSALREPTVNNDFPVQDLRLRAGSPAVDAGTPTGTRDFLGAAPDLGYFETDGTEEPAPPTTSADAIGEIGTSRTSNAWKTVSLTRSYDNPVVVLSPLSWAGGEPATTRVRNVTPTSFEWQVDEWEYLDQGHATEDVRYVVVEAGAYTLDNGAVLQAGNWTASSTFSYVPFGTEMTETPVVFAQPVTNNESEAVVPQLTDLGTLGFQVRLREEETLGAHGAERVSWIALEPGTSDGEGTGRFEASRTGRLDVDTRWRTLDFAQSYTATDRAVFVGLQSTFGGDPMPLRLNVGNRVNASGFTNTSLQYFGQEEQSRDAETAHTTEVVGYWVVGGSGELTGEALVGGRQAPASSALASAEGGIRVANPARFGEVVVELPLSLTDRGEVRATLLTLDGAAVAERVSTEDRVLTLDARDLPDGMYLVNVTGGAYSNTVPVVIAD